MIEERGKSMATLIAGSYTQESKEGIYWFDIDPQKEYATLCATAAQTPNPSFLAARGNRLYAVSEQLNNGWIDTYALEDRQLTYLSRLPVPGSCLCHLSQSTDGQMLFAAGYMSGNVSACLLGANGIPVQLACQIQHRGQGTHPQRQEGPHAHSVTPDPTGQFVLAADLGLDRLLIYRIHPETGMLAANAAQPFVALPPGEGPRHFAFSPAGRHGYLTTELQNHIVVFDWNGGDGVLTAKQTLPLLPLSFTGEALAADVHLSADGRFLYASVRGGDLLAAFAVLEDGLLEPLGFFDCGGQWPRHFCFSEDGNWLAVANQFSHCVSILPRDPATGHVGAVQQKLDVPEASFVMWQAE